MASVLAAGHGKIFICSSEKVSCLENMDLENIKSFNPSDKSTYVEELTDEVKKSANHQNGGSKESTKQENGGKSGLSCMVCMGVSSCGDYLAVCGEDKVLTVFNKSDKVCSAVLTRKASKIAFTKDQEWVVLADKNGDVYKVNIKAGIQTKPILVLGHLSMLLDILLTPSNRFIITADRDEKIRVSSFPNGYNINNFCLGHTDFVTSISMVGDDELVSGSGDGTIRVWRFLDGVQLDSRDVHKDCEVKLDRKVEINNSVTNNLQEMDIGRKRNEPNDAPAVIKVKGLHRSTLFLVQVEGLNGLLLYSFNNTLEKVQLIATPFPVIDFDIEQTNSLVILSRAAVGGKAVVLRKYPFSSRGGVFDPAVEYPLPADVLQTSDEEQDGLKNLHKRWFDNMKDYMERKQTRIEKSKGTQPTDENSSCDHENSPCGETPCKKQKIES
jgi:hypothetical protein